MSLVLFISSAPVFSSGNAAPAGNEAKPSCADAQGLRFICGPANAEDMARIPRSDWVIATSMAGPGVAGDRMNLISVKDRSWIAVDPSALEERRDPRYSACTGRLTGGRFSGHGLYVGDAPLRAYVVNHGDRESIEIFDIALHADAPILTWAGCLVGPPNSNLNAVAALPDGGIAATSFRDARDTTEQWTRKLAAGEPTGFVIEWHPHTGWIRIPESEMSGPNGLLVSRDGRYYYLADWGGRRFVRLTRDRTPSVRDSIVTPFMADNLRWDDDHHILVTGQAMTDPWQFIHCMMADNRICAMPFGVMRIDADTLASRELVHVTNPPAEFGAASTALSVGEEWWIGTTRGDRIARIQQTHGAAN